MKNILKIGFISLTLLCTTAVFASEQEAPDFINGAKVWADTCMRCHNVRPPEDYNKRAWAYSINHMRVRAGLTGKEARDILEFIITSKTESDAK